MKPKPTPVILGPDLMALLQEMGLAWDEVRIYQFLLNSSSAISSAIARETGHSRGRIYEALRRLGAKGLVREEPTKPITFHPAPLAEVLANAHTRLTRQLAAVSAQQGVTPASIDPGVLLPQLTPTRARDVRVFTGRRACHAEWLRMMEDAQEFFWLTGGENLARRLAALPSMVDGLCAARDRGVTVELVLPETPASADALAKLNARLGPAHLELATVDSFGPLVSCTTDQASMEVIVQPDDAAPNQGQDVGIQVSSEFFANATNRRVQVAERSHAAKGAAPVYQWLGPNHGSDLFLEAVRGAKKDVLVLGPREWSTYLAVDWEKNDNVYRDARERGVTFRAVTTPESGGDAVLAPFGDIWDIRFVDWHPVWLTLVDGQELYQAFSHPSLGGPPQFRQSREPNELRFYNKLFEQLWTQGAPAKP